MKEKTNILVVDDELGIRDLLSSELNLRDYAVSTASNGEEAVEKVKSGKFQLVISDVKMPRMDGLEMLDQIKRLDPDVEIIMSTGYGTIETAVSAMKRGAYDFVQKPFNLDEILALVEKALEKNELKTLVGIYEASKAIFSSIKLDSLLGIMAKLATTILKADDASIMLMSPDGRLVAAAVHGLEEDARKKARLALGERVAGRVAQSKEPVIISGPLKDDPRFSDVPALRDIRSSLVYPLMLDGKVLGVLNANRTRQTAPFTASELRHTTIFGAQIAQAIHNANLYRELEQKIQEIQAMQDQLVQSEKQAAIGRLAAGVAHEINNPLTGILGFTELMLQGDDLSSSQREDLESIHHQSQRCRKIVQNLLQFSRRRKPAAEEMPLGEVLRPVLDLVRYDFRVSDIEIQVLLPDALPPVHGDRSQLEQVFLNLITNARHAMEGRNGGVLKISASREAGRMLVRFQDNGQGIAAEDLSRIFDPFFTTKPVGQGTGLGLSISHGIIQQHQGTIRVESRPGAGACFTVELPVRLNEEPGKDEP